MMILGAENPDVERAPPITFNMSFSGARAALGKTALKSIFGVVIATGS
jgi:hypothetical protein